MNEDLETKHPRSKGRGCFLFAWFWTDGDYHGRVWEVSRHPILHLAMGVGGCQRSVGRCRKQGLAAADGHRPLSRAPPSIVSRTPRSPRHHAPLASPPRSGVAPSIPTRQVLKPKSTSRGHVSDIFSNRLEPHPISLRHGVHGFFPRSKPMDGTFVHAPGTRLFFFLMLFFLLPLLFFFHPMRSRKKGVGEERLGGERRGFLWPPSRVQ